MRVPEVQTKKEPMASTKKSTRFQIWNSYKFIFRAKRLRAIRRRGYVALAIAQGDDQRADGHDSMEDPNGARDADETRRV